MKNSIRHVKNGFIPKIENIILFIIIFFIIIEIIPYIITIIFPDICYGCSNIGKYQQYLNKTINLGYISWVCYIILFIYFIYKSLYFTNNILRYFVILLSLFMIYLPTLPLLNIITMLLCIVYNNPPFIHNYHNIFQPSIEIENNSNKIINEFKEYSKNFKPECVRKTNPGFKIEENSVDGNCWRALYLKKFGIIDENMKSFFPTTIELIKDEQIHNAFFSILDPGVEIPEHVGYYKGYLRYHMGVIIPNNNNTITDNKAYIVCGNEKYIWKENEGIVFDDMYLHYVRNPSNQIRVVLYLDIIRKHDNYVINKINSLGIYLIQNSIVLNSFLKNQHGQNKINNYNHENINI